MRRPPVMDKLVAAAREALAAGRTTIRVTVPADMADELPFGEVVATKGETASVEVSARMILLTAEPDA